MYTIVVIILCLGISIGFMYVITALTPSGHCLPETWAYSEFD